MEPSGRIKHTGPPQSTAGRGLRPDAPVFTPQGHCDDPQFGPPQHMHQNPNQPPTGNVFPYSQAAKKQPENVNYQRNDYQREHFQNIQDERVQPESSINNLPQPGHTNSTTSWRVTSIPQQGERQDSQRNDYQKGNFQNNQIESVQPFEPENIRNLPQPNQRNSTTRAVDNNVEPNERQNRQDFSSSDYKGNSAKVNFNKTSQKSARVDESCNLYQEINSRPQNHSVYQAKGHSRSRGNYQKENDQRRTSTNNFNKNTADHDNSRCNNRGHKPRDNNYDSRRISTNNSSKYGADNNRDNSNSVEPQITPDSWEDNVEQNNDIPPKNAPATDSLDDDDVKQHTKPKEEHKAKNTDSRQCHEKSPKKPKNVHQDKGATDSREKTDENDSAWNGEFSSTPKKGATDSREKTDENDSAWNGEFSSTPKKPEHTSQQCVHQRNKPKDPRMDREKLNKSESSIFRDQSYTDKTVRRSDGNYRQMSGVSDKEIWDKEFNKWDRTWKQIKDFKIVTEIQGDLFEQPKEYSLAHCVAEDLKMGSGIAVAFKREFKNVPDLLDQRAKQGGLAVLPDEKNKRFVYYLVTKRESNGKPTYFTLWKSLCNMKEHIKQNGVKNLAIPRLACGLDRLDWDMVKSMIEFLFTDVDVKITVCNFQQNHSKTKKKLQTHASVDKGKSKKNRNKKMRE